MRNPICLLTLSLFAAGPAAYASRPENVSGTELHESTIRIARVRIQGTLICDAGNHNDGSPCNLMIQDSRTGRLIRLIEANEAMRLYQSGTRKVALEGTMPDRDTMAVTSTEAQL